MAGLAGSFIWYELMCADPDTAARFYGAVVGWTIPAPGSAAPLAVQDYRTIQRRDGGSAGGVLKLTDEMQRNGARPTWIGYLHVTDVDVAVKAIEADGGTTWFPKRTLPVGDIAMVADPMGAPFYVMRPVPMPGNPDAVSDVFDVKASQHIRWNELHSADLAKAKAFYARHFGFEFRDSMPMGPLGDYCFIDHGGVRIGAVMQKTADNPFGTWQFYFGVDSVMAAQRAIADGGGQVLHAAHEVPGGDWITIATDPEGALFGVVGPKGE